MKLIAEPFDRVKNGKKIIEVRLFDDKRKAIKLGDLITFLKLPNLDESITTEVVGLSRFNSFKKLFSVFGTNPFGHPENKTIEEQVLGMRDAYSEESEKKFGVLGIHIRLIS
jgi:ASC-1-like (ASCH) protein